MTWELDPDNRPHPSDFREEMEEEAYFAWCKEQGLDWYEAASAAAYEAWFEDYHEV